MECNRRDDCLAWWLPTFKGILYVWIYINMVNLFIIKYILIGLHRSNSIHELHHWGNQRLKCCYQLDEKLQSRGCVYGLLKFLIPYWSPRQWYTHYDYHWWKLIWYYEQNIRLNFITAVYLKRNTRRINFLNYPSGLNTIRKFARKLEMWHS